MSEIKNNKPFKIIELDELHAYIQHKKLPLGVVGVDRNEREFIDFVVGDRSSQIGIKLWQNIENEHIDIVFPTFGSLIKKLFQLKSCTKTKQKILLLKDLIV